jgi:hypothetical protein
MVDEGSILLKITSVPRHIMIEQSLSTTFQDNRLGMFIKNDTFVKVTNIGTFYLLGYNIM